MALLNSSERRLAEAISSLTFCNPFVPGRMELERAVLDGDYIVSDRSWNFPLTGQDQRPNETLLRNKVAAFITALRRRMTEKKGPDSREWQLYQDSVVHYLYYFLEGDFYRSMADGKTKPDYSAVYARFLEQFQRLLRFAGQERRCGYQPEHLFACCYQVTRAFQGIYRSIIGFSPCMIALRARVWESIFTYDMRIYQQELYDKMGDIATLIIGASGTGKERVAQAIAQARYLPFNAATGRFAELPENLFSTTVLSALSPHLIESELFGHVRGSFTGALQDRKGRLESCPPHGSLFLDEIGDADPQIQVKLLRVLQYRTFERVGESVPRMFQGKIIAATNRDLRSDMQTGKFREDFYFRLCSDVINTPSLRQQIAEAPEDVENLINFITQKLIAAQSDRQRLNADVKAWIQRHREYAWPGNFRELEQCVKNMLLRRNYQPPELISPDPVLRQLERIKNGAMTEAELLRVYTTLVYQRTGTYEAAARNLGIDRRTVKSRVAGHQWQ
jgi:hypothetical protein